MSPVKLEHEILKQTLLSFDQMSLGQEIIFNLKFDPN